MRYYDLTLGSLHYTSLGGPSGNYNPGTLQVEFEIQLSAKNVSDQYSHFRVWGPGMQDISQANTLVNMPIMLYGGMQAGLPLANPAQAGPLCGGTVYQAFGNWIGTDQTLDVIGTTGTLPPAMGSGGPKPLPSSRNIVHNWMKGQDLGQSLQQALQQAFPGMQVNMAIGQYMAPSDQQHFAGTVEQFQDHIRQYTQYLQGAMTPQAMSPQGVSIHFKPDGQTISVFDGSQMQMGGTINYQDLIGQPTWIEVDTISVKLVMRGDLSVGDTVTLPQTIVTNSALAGASSGSTSGAPQTSLTFQGPVTIQKITHTGNFRQPDAAAWVTVLVARVQSS